MNNFSKKCRYDTCDTCWSCKHKEIKKDSIYCLVNGTQNKVPRKLSSCEIISSEKCLLREKVTFEEYIREL